MRKFIAFLALLALFLSFTAPAFAQSTQPDLLTVLDNDGRFTTLLAAIDAAGLTDTLKGDGPYTLLAPTDDAFAALLTNTGMTQDQLLANTDTLKEILLYHLLPGKYFFRQLTSGPTLDTSLEGQQVTFNLDTGVFTVQGVNIPDADYLASNGIVDVLDGVMLPPDVAAALMTPEPTAEATEASMGEMAAISTPEATPVAGVPEPKPDILTVLANDGRFTVLLAAINSSPTVTDLLTNGGPFTVLAPTDDAFAALLSDTGMTQDQLLADRATLTQILLYHILPGEYFFRQLTSGPTLPSSLLGQSVSFNLDSGVFTVNGANIPDADYLAANGVVDALDAVILPPSVAAAMATPEPTAEPTAEPTPDATPEATPVAGVPEPKPDILTVLANDGRFTVLLAAINSSPTVTDLLTNGGPFTVLAPTDDAFAALLSDTGMTQDQLLADRATLTQILLYHILPGEYFFRQLTSGPTLPSSLLGQSVTFNLDSGVFTVNGANIPDADYIASNGVVDALDAVILPPSVAAAMATPEPTEAPTAEPTVAPTPAATPEATEAAGVPEPRPDLLTTLQNDGRFTVLLAAIDAAGLTDTLNGGGPFTLLAPTDDAFAAAFSTLGITQDQALAERNILNQILLYHVIPGRYYLRQLTSGPTLGTLLPNQSVTFNLDSGVFTVQGANISDADYLASNGVVHVIDSVMIPPAVQALLPSAAPTEAPTAEPTVEPTPEATPEVAGVPEARPDILSVLDSDGRFTTLLAAIAASPTVTDLLTNGGPFTLLAPTDDAFAAFLTQTGMTQDQLLADRATLTQILLYHILPGQYFFRQLTSGPTLPSSLLGQSVTFNLDSGVFTVDGANIPDADYLASNGVVDALDAVILPPSLQGLLTQPRVRFADFSPDAGTMDVSVNGAPAVLTNISFGSVSDWMPMAAGSYQITLTPANGAPIQTTVNVSANEWITIGLTGSAAQSTLLATDLYENTAPLADGMARVGFFDAVENRTPYDVLVDGQSVVVRLGYPGSLGGNDGYFSVDLAAGSHDVKFVIMGQPSNVVIDLPNVTLDAGNTYLIAAAGSTGGPAGVIVESDGTAALPAE